MDLAPFVLDIETYYLTFPSSVEECSTFSAAEAIHKIPIFVSIGTHYYWVAGGGVDSKLAQGFYT